MTWRGLQQRMKMQSKNRTNRKLHLDAANIQNEDQHGKYVDQSLPFYIHGFFVISFYVLNGSEVSFSLPQYIELEFRNLFLRSKEWSLHSRHLKKKKVIETEIKGGDGRGRERERKGGRKEGRKGRRRMLGRKGKRMEDKRGRSLGEKGGC